MLKKWRIKNIFLRTKPLRLVKKNIIKKSYGIEIEIIGSLVSIKKEQILELKELIDQFGYVLMRGKNKLTPEQQVQFTQKLGDLETFKVPFDKSYVSNKILKFSNISRMYQKSLGFLWHSDGAFNARPSYLTVYHMASIPENSETCFASLQEAYRVLPQNLKMQWESYQAVYTSGIDHPLILKHPYTGKYGIYVDLGYIESFVDKRIGNKKISLPEFNTMIQFFHDVFSKPENYYCHTWRLGDVIIIDNYAITHKDVVAIDGNALKEIHRTNIKGIYI
ncbi:TauD/TfdA family dioxygenase [uncultured Aquimarina sp.]|uniref:TauD/TfdA dioxygenase family protein n=1 Tax=uncultured Aquimarina sp. TaxID=575652 RepID=UPI00261FAE38|nr:TauD/TfdA family dioxygenase [uncultured Aquimarina sp.]